MWTKNENRQIYHGSYTRCCTAPHDEIARVVDVVETNNTTNVIVIETTSTSGNKTDDTSMLHFVSYNYKYDAGLNFEMLLEPFVCDL